MRTRGVLAVAFLAAAFFWGFPEAQAKDTIRLVIMPAEAPRREAPKYEDLGLYMQVRSANIEEVQLRIAKDFREAVELFQAGKVDGIFAASFVAGVLIKKGQAKPLVRPVLTSGRSTYRTLIVARAGTKPFGGLADLRGKKVAFCALAAAGEIYVRSLLAAGEKLESVLTPVFAPTHQAALEAVDHGDADYAVVKSLVWEALEFKKLAVVGEDKAEHPNNTLVLSGAAFEKHGEEIQKIMLRLGSDSSFGALDIKKAMGAKGFVATSNADFAPTFELIEKTRIDPAKFEFAF